MRLVQRVFALSTVLLTQGCMAAALAAERIAPKCIQEQIVATWPITITRSGVATTRVLTNTLTQTNIDRAQFDVLKKVLTGAGGSGIYNVTWGIPAFDVNGGYIAFTHPAPLQTGETQKVSVAFSGGGWGAQPTGAALPPAVALRADNYTATSASGTITALATSPLRLRIDVTTANNAGESIRVAGDVGFAYFKVTALCN